MRKLYCLLSAMLLTGVSFASLPVDTTIQNKKVVLECFGGYSYLYRPDADRIGQELMRDYPGDVYLINVHSGSTAKPMHGILMADYRTPFGELLDSISGVSISAHRIGTVNRRHFPSLTQHPEMALHRAEWEDAVQQVLSENSYVNLALEAQIDIDKRELTVNVQMYFTGWGAPDSVYLNLALLQNNMKGIAIGAYLFPERNIGPALWNYNHMYMLRHMITGQWGHVIDSTGQGMLIERQYTYSLPHHINDIPMMPGNLQVIGFIAEEKTNIVTANKATMSYVLPTGKTLVDLSVKYEGDIPLPCQYFTEPEIKVYNVGEAYADTFYVGYSINESQYLYQEISSGLAPGDSTMVTIPPVMLYPGKNTITFSVSVEQSGHLMELHLADNTYTIPDFYTVPVQSLGNVLQENFEGYSAYDVELDNAFNLSMYYQIYVVNESVLHFVNHPLGAYEQSENSLAFAVHSLHPKTSARVAYEKLNLAGSKNTKLRFDYAYKQFHNQEDTFRINVSVDCGLTWNTVYEKIGSNLETTDSIHGGYHFSPVYSQWQSDTIDLATLDGEPEVLIAFELATGMNQSDVGKVPIGVGANFYLDNLLVFDDYTVSTDDKQTLSQWNVYPNPVHETVNIDLYLDRQSVIYAELMDAVGKSVVKVHGKKGYAGKNSFTLNTAGLKPGIYFLRVISGNQMFTKQLSVIK